jgi:hypothetical protein
VDARPARDHLALLAEHGISPARAAALAGVSAAVVGRLVGWDTSRPARRVRPATLAKLLAVTPHPSNADPGARVCGVGTTRKLQALVALGWPQAVLATRLGRIPTNLGRLLHASQPRVNAATWRAVDALWEELQATPGPSTRARTIAAKRGWPPPLAWDDIDNPDARPVTTRTPARRTNAARLDDLTDLLASGTSVHEACTRCGWSGPDAASRAAYRQGRHDLVRWLSRKTTTP